MKKYDLLITEIAENGLYEIYNYVANNDSLGKAESLLEKVELLMHALELNPTRGHYLPELLRVGIKEYRDVHFKPYRIIYCIDATTVMIMCILDGRRDVNSYCNKDYYTDLLIITKVPLSGFLSNLLPERAWA